MFSLRRFPVRSCKISSLLSQSTTPIASRAVAISTPKVATPALSVSFAIQKRCYGEDRGPRAFGSGNGGPRSSPGFQSHRGSDGKPLKPTAVVYVGNLQFDVTEDILKSHFESIGPIQSVRIIHDVRGMSKGFGYIDFGDVALSSKAVEAMNNSLFAGRRLNVQFLAKPQQARLTPNPPSKTLFIGNMNYEMTDDDINELFKDIANCLDIRVAMDRRTGQPRGFAHADFVSVEAAVAAKEKLEGREFFGRSLRIDFSARQRDDDGNLLPGAEGAEGSQ